MCSQSSISNVSASVSNETIQCVFEVSGLNASAPRSAHNTFSVALGSGDLVGGKYNKWKHTHTHKHNKKHVGNLYRGKSTTTQTHPFTLHVLCKSAGLPSNLNLRAIIPSVNLANPNSTNTATSPNTTDTTNSTDTTNATTTTPASTTTTTASGANISLQHGFSQGKSLCCPLSPLFIQCRFCNWCSQKKFTLREQWFGP